MTKKTKLILRAEHNVEILRQKRTKLFKAFDIYKSNVEYGVINEDSEAHSRIVKWYADCLDLNFEAINTCPEEIKRYLKN